MTNWPHSAEMKTLRADVVALNGLLPVRSILIDTVRHGMLPAARYGGRFESARRSSPHDGC